MNRTEATRGVSKSGEGEGHGASKVGLVASSAFTTRAGVRLITDVRPVSTVPRRQENPGPWVHSGLEHDGDLHRVLSMVLLPASYPNRESAKNSANLRISLRFLYKAVS